MNTGSNGDSLMGRFPHSDPLAVGQSSVAVSRIIELARAYLTPERQARIQAAVAGRTYSIVPVLEGIYDRGNISAVMRSAEAMGYQRVHVIETGEKFKKANRVTQGSDKWLDVTRWQSTKDCARHLKDAGYRIYATHLDEAAKSIDEIDFSHPAAIVLGNEKDGVSAEMLKVADERIIIPMHGFVQSFNISVAGAIALYHIRQDRVRSLGAHGDLSASERQILEALFHVRSTKNPERLFARLMSLEGMGKTRNNNLENRRE